MNDDRAIGAQVNEIAVPWPAQPQAELDVQRRGKLLRAHTCGKPNVRPALASRGDLAAPAAELEHMVFGVFRLKRNTPRARAHLPLGGQPMLEVVEEQRALGQLTRRSDNQAKRDQACVHANIPPGVVTSAAGRANLGPRMAQPVGARARRGRCPAT